MSNCKPDDLAIIVRGPSQCSAAIVGRIVTVTTPIFYEVGLCWEYEGPPIRCPLNPFCQFDALRDDSLRPIRGDEGEHPGDVLRKPTEKPVPVKTGVKWLAPADFKP